MEEAYDALADRVQAALEQRGDSPSPWLVGVAGVPGSGKSSLVQAVCKRLCERGTPAVVVPMDGFHYYRAQLDAMPDPPLAHARRGAEWTFDARSYHACLAGIKATGDGLAPTFEHGVGDPRPAGVAVQRHHRVVLSEGNYLLLGAEPWWRLGELWDDTWYVDCCVDEAMRRVFRRQTGNGVAAQTSRWRIAANDRQVWGGWGAVLEGWDEGPNAEQIATTRGRAALVVPGTLPQSAAVAEAA
ncbi:uridine kinase [Micractinium conductrix]|uniref:Uridine kinase n=1 Tax=Micractinium conductrix TaxID=554055 RepID=A0A2P6VAQ5_9CHLO|nr:uridine kinase [Micractinium conductrix]|eukprot:PSC71182.1 uridine kinase [Micractinium conductrix]